MTANTNSIDLAEVLSEYVERAEPDLLRSLLKTFVQAFDERRGRRGPGAAYGTRSEERTNSRNG